MPLEVLVRSYVIYPNDLQEKEENMFSIVLFFFFLWEADIILLINKVNFSTQEKKPN